MTEEEGQDEETVAKLLQLNDYLHSLVEKFELLRKGDFGGAGAVNTKAPSGSATSKAVVSDLIDFGDDEPAAGGAGGATPAGNSGSGSGAAVDDLLGDLNGLSFNNSSGFGQGGSISLLGPLTQVALPPLLCPEPLESTLAHPLDPETFLTWTSLPRHLLLLLLLLLPLSTFLLSPS